MVTCTVPERGTGTVTVTASNNFGADASVGQLSFEYRAGMFVRSILPSHGPVSGGTSVTLSGAGLLGGVDCMFGERAAAASVVDDAKVVCMSPAGGSPGELKLRVTSLDGAIVHDGLQYGYYEAPQITRVWPSQGSPLGGTIVSVTGSGYKSGELQCRFGGVAVRGRSVACISSSLLTCESPVSTEQNAQVLVEISMNDGSDFTRNSRLFVYEVGAFSESLFPSSGRVNQEGQVVTVVGQSFKETAELSCRFGLDKVSQGRFISSTMIACTVPKRGAGRVSVSVSNTGTDYSSSKGSWFDYKSDCALFSLIPSNGPVRGGTIVTINGFGFDSQIDESLCRFGNAEVEVWNATSTQLLCSSPKSVVAGATSLEVSGNGMKCSGNLEYTFDVSISIFDLRPSRGNIYGGTAVTVRANGLVDGALRCRFGSQVVSGSEVSWMTSTMMLCMAPKSYTQGAVEVEVSVNDGADFTTHGETFMYDAAATLQELLPSVGVSGKAGQVVTIVGNNFIQSHELGCRFGLNGIVTGLYISSSNIVCVLPSLLSSNISVNVMGLDIPSSSRPADDIDSACRNC